MDNLYYCCINCYLIRKEIRLRLYTYTSIVKMVHKRKGIYIKDFFFFSVFNFFSKYRMILWKSLCAITSFNLKKANKVKQTY